MGHLLRRAPRKGDLVTTIRDFDTRTTYTVDGDGNTIGVTTDAEQVAFQPRTISDSLREEIERVDLAQMDIDADGPLSGETAAALARIRVALHAQVVP